MSASVKGDNGVLNSIIPTATLDDQIQSNKCRIQRRQVSQQHETPTSELRSMQKDSDSEGRRIMASPVDKASQQSSTKKCKTADARQPVDEHPTRDDANKKARQFTEIIISAKVPLKSEYATVPDFRANIYGTASTIQLYDDATAASVPLATAPATQKPTDGDPAQPAMTSPYEDNNFSKEKGDIDIGNKLPTASCQC